MVWFLSLSVAFVRCYSDLNSVDIIIVIDELPNCFDLLIDFFELLLMNQTNCFLEGFTFYVELDYLFFNQLVSKVKLVVFGVLLELLYPFSSHIILGFETSILFLHITKLVNLYPQLFRSCQRCFEFSIVNLFLLVQLLQNRNLFCVNNWLFQVSNHKNSILDFFLGFYQFLFHRGKSFNGLFSTI